MKKVLFTATVDSHILNFHIPYLKLFKDNGYEVHVATNGNEKIPHCDKKHIISFERSPYKINNLRAIKQLKKVIETEKFDIIHCHTPMGSVVTRLASKKARKKYKTRVIYTAHGFHFYKGAPLLNWILFYPIEKWLAKYTDTLITINNEDYELAKKKFSKRCKDIQYVPGVGIDCERFNIGKGKDSSIRKELGLSEKDFLLTYIARLDKNKNQGFLIDIIKKLNSDYPEIHLLLVGPDEINNKYQEQAKNFEKNIHFLGYRKDIPSILSETNISVSSSLREGLPVNILEAMAVGIPVIATDTRGVRDLIKNGINGYVVKKNDKDEFIKRILELYNDKKLSRNISKNNLKDIKKYDIENILVEMRKIYNRKKIILHLLASNRYSGAENVACTIINKLKNDCDMYYCSPIGPIGDILKEKGINYVPIKKISYGEIKKIISTIKPDIIHAHDNKATVISSFFYKKCFIISHIHGNNRIMNSFNLKTLLFNFCSKRVGKFIWVSDSSLNGYYFRKRIINKSEVLYNVIDNKEIKNKSELYDLKEKYDICFLGRLGYPKNVLRFINIIRAVKNDNTNVKVAIVGDGPDRKLVEEKIVEYNLNCNIKMYGYLTNPYPILKNSKILVMTSIYEGTPMCALEAQALEKPIVATKVDGLINLVENDFNGFLSDSDAELINKILSLISDEKEYDRFVFNTKSKFAEFNNINNYMHHIKNVYKL